MRQEATNSLNEWIADELLCKAPTGGTEAELRGRFSASAAAAGLSSDEVEQSLTDPDMASVARKHRGGA